MGAVPMSETQRTEPDVRAERPAYTLASPEFFHLLQRIEQTETVLRGEIAGLRGEIKQAENALRGEIVGLRGEIAGLRGETTQMEAGLRGEIKQTETVLRGEIKQTENALRGEIAGLRNWVIVTLVAVALSTIGLAIFR